MFLFKFGSFLIPILEDDDTKSLIGGHGHSLIVPEVSKCEYYLKQL